jgi:hypothetical protein
VIAYYSGRTDALDLPALLGTTAAQLGDAVVRHARRR